MPDPELAVPCRYGRLLTIASDAFASESVRRYGEWAQQELDLMGALVAPGDWIVDAGAYIGTHTLAFSRFVGPSGHVVSFEPRREAFRLLQANVEAVNRLDNVRIFNRALGTEDGSLELRPLATDAERANPGGQSAIGIHDPSSSYTVDIVTLDGLDLDRLDLVKLDVEGAEPSIIAGARATIERHRPIVFVELNTIGLGVEVLAAMRAHAGYEVYGSISAAFNPENFRRSADNIFADAAETALLFVPTSKRPRVEALLDTFRLAPIDGIDDLALVLLHKPQYPHEALRDTRAGQRLGIDYPSPRAWRLEEAIRESSVAHASTLSALERTHAAEIATRDQAHAAELAKRDQAHAEALEALRREADTRLAATIATLEKAHAEGTDALMRQHASRVVELTNCHVAELNEISSRAADRITTLEGSIQALHRSHSWRLTMPLRCATTMLRRALGRSSPTPP